MSTDDGRLRNRWAMVTLAALGMATIAEGVETPEQFALVQSEGCTQAQGYLFATPQPAKDIRRLLADFRAVA